VNRCSGMLRSVGVLMGHIVVRRVAGRDRL
jgi:hypothetical protein